LPAWHKRQRPARAAGSSSIKAVQVDDAPGSVCMKPAIRGLTVVGLLTGLGLLYLGYAYA